MKTLLFIILLFVTITVEAQRFYPGDTIVVTNEAWNCGGITEERALVVMYRGRLYVRYGFTSFTPSEDQVLYTVRKALAYWKYDNTVILRVIKRK